MSFIQTCALNILETASVSLSVGTADPAYPSNRLFDRDIGKLCIASAASTFEVKLNQGVSGNLAVDRLLIPAGHNLQGMSLSLKYSADDNLYYDAIAPWTQADDALISQAWASLSKRYWKFAITNPAIVPQISEIFFTSTYAWPRNPQRPAGPLDEEFNVDRLLTSGGQVRFLQNGVSKRHRQYSNIRCGEAQKVALLALNTLWAGGRPFWMCDHAGNWIFGELIAKINMQEVAYQQYSYTFDFLEVIA